MVRAVKKKNGIVALFALGGLLLFGGCYEPLEITDREMDMVAEYAAGVLVEHGTKTEEKLLDREEQAEAAILSATPTPRPTLTPAGKEESSTPSATVKPETVATATPEPTKIPDNTELTMQDLTKLLEKKEFFFRYTGSTRASIYEGENNLFAAAEEGKTLVVLNFEIMNTSSSEAMLEMNQGASKDFVYTLQMGSYSVKPSLTLLQEDLYTSYKEKFSAGEKKNGVLVFECQTDKLTDSMTLMILKDMEGKEDSVLIKVE
jgi:hypothetical protein